MKDSIKRNVLLNPGPATTTDTVKYAQVVPDICPREKEFCELMVVVREKIVKVVSNNIDKYTAIVFGGSGTAAVEACISSVVPPQGKILICINGAYGTRMAQIAERYYRKERVVKYEQAYGDYPDLNKLEEIINSDSDITHIGVIHHETTTGMLNPVKEIAQLAHKNNIQVIVDAMSSYAGLAIDIENDGFDYVISSSNKCIQGMAGLSFVITAKDNIKRMKDYPKTNLYLNLYEQYEYFEKTGQMRYTPPVQAIYALNQALDEFFVETGVARYRRYAGMWKKLISGIEKLGLKLMLPIDQHSKLLTAIFDPDSPKYDFNKMHDYLYERGFTIYPGKVSSANTFRIANIGALNKKDIEGFLRELSNYIKIL